MRTKHSMTSCEIKKDADEIPMNAIVISYDFEWNDDCYIIGKMVGFKEIEGCRRYCIDVYSKVFCNEFVNIGVDERCFPPVNGTPNLFGGFTNCVKKVS